MLREKPRNEKRSTWELTFLAHVIVNDGIRVWAQENDVPLVDIIKRLDSRRDLLLSWVHPGPEENVMIAELLAEAILDAPRLFQRLGQMSPAGVAGVD